MHKNSTRAGFTLVELIVVIMILVILAAFAVPRFAELEVEARSAATATLAGNLRSSAALSHALWLAQGGPSTVVLEGRVITMTNGYPDVASINDAIASLDGFVHDDARAPGLFLKADAKSAPIANCSVSYSSAQALGAAPTITLDTTGC